MSATASLRPSVFGIKQQRCSASMKSRSSEVKSTTTNRPSTLNITNPSVKRPTTNTPQSPRDANKFITRSPTQPPKKIIAKKQVTKPASMDRSEKPTEDIDTLKLNSKGPECENLTETSEDLRFQLAIYSQFSALDNRLQTYEDWPQSMPQRPKVLAEAGLFYVGRGDKVVCYHCGGGINRWEPEDDPWIEHAKHYPYCLHVKLMKGADFIDAAQNRSQEVPVPSPTIVEEKKINTYNPGPVADRVECKICFQNEVSLVLIPCGHTLCAECSLAVDKCGICRSPIKALQKVYI